MSFASLLIDSVTIGQRTAGAADDYGNPTVTFPPDAAVPARVQQVGVAGRTREILGGRDTTVTWYHVFLPAGTSVDAFDRINWEGNVYEVDGVPEAIDDGSGAHHIELIMKKAV